MPVTVTIFAKVGEVVPPIACALVLKVAPPAEKEAPLLVMPFLKIKFAVAEMAVLVQLPEEFTVTAPVKVEVPVPSLSVNVPLLTDVVVPTEIFPVPPNIKVPDVVTARLPLIVKF